MIHHIVLVRWREQTLIGDIEAAVGSLEQLRSIEGVAEIAYGSNLGLLQSNAYNFTLTARLHSREALLAYGPHPIHQHVLGKLSALMADALIIDFEV